MASVLNYPDNNHHLFSNVFVSNAIEFRII
jgi:hypothetical protein